MEELKLFNEEQQELIAEAVELDTDEKTEYKYMHETADAASKDLLLDKQVITRFKDYSYYYGRGWVNGNPLERGKGDESVEYPDRVSSIMIKFNQIIQDCIQVGDINFLTPYLQALDAKGIHITIDGAQADAARLQKVDQYIQPMCANQANICNIADQIKGPLTEAAVEKKISSKSKFRTLVRLTNKLQKAKEKGEDATKAIDKVTDIYTDANTDADGAVKTINGYREGAENLDSII